jgi:hypothetical protein
MFDPARHAAILEGCFTQGLWENGPVSRQLKGVGPVGAAKLQEAGLTTFPQLLAPTACFRGTLMPTVTAMTLVLGKTDAFVRNLLEMCKSIVRFSVQARLHSNVLHVELLQEGDAETVGNLDYLLIVGIEHGSIIFTARISEASENEMRFRFEVEPQLLVDGSVLKIELVNSKMIGCNEEVVIELGESSSHSGSANANSTKGLPKPAVVGANRLPTRGGGGRFFLFESTSNRSDQPKTAHGRAP